MLGYWIFTSNFFLTKGFDNSILCMLFTIYLVPYLFYRWQYLWVTPYILHRSWTFLRSFQFCTSMSSWKLLSSLGNKMASKIASGDIWIGIWKYTFPISDTRVKGHSRNTKFLGKPFPRKTAFLWSQGEMLAMKFQVNKFSFKCHWKLIMVRSFFYLIPSIGLKDLSPWW